MSAWSADLLRGEGFREQISGEGSHTSCCLGVAQQQLRRQGSGCSSHEPSYLPQSLHKQVSAHSCHTLHAPADECHNDIMPHVQTRVQSLSVLPPCTPTPTFFVMAAAP